MVFILNAHSNLPDVGFRAVVEDAVFKNQLHLVMELFATLIHVRIQLVLGLRALILLSFRNPWAFSRCQSSR